MTSNILGRLFDTQTRVCYKPGLEGCERTSAAFLLGDRAGPQVHVANLLHEVAHFIEIDDQRCFSSGWGFRYPDPAKTCRAVEREARVWGIQWRLCDVIGVTFLPFEHARLFEFINGNECVPGGTMLNAANNVSRWIVDAKNNWPLDRILTEWDRKCLLKTHGPGVD